MRERCGTLIVKGVLLMTRLTENPDRPSRFRRPATVVPVPREPVFDAEAFKRVCAKHGWSRRAFRERSGISMATLDSLRSGRVVPTTAVSFRLALALPEEDLREVFGGDPQAQRPTGRGYDRRKDVCLRTLPATDLGDGRILHAGIYSYDGGRPTLRAHLRIGRRPPILVARVPVQDVVLAAHLVGLIADVAFPTEPSNDTADQREVMP
jgi:transcriptional regulator with XRE-family HTH domain